MRRHRSLIVPIAFTSVASYFVLGCGANVTIDLPNSHYVLVANSRDVVICSGTGEAVTKWSVGRLADSGDYVYGTIVDPESQLLQEFFVLNTATGATQYHPSKQEWAAALGAVGVADLSLRGPSAFYDRGVAMWWRVVLAAVFTVGVLLIILVWLCRRREAGERGRVTS